MSQHGSVHGTPGRAPPGKALPTQHPLSRQLGAADSAWQLLHNAVSPDAARTRLESPSASAAATPSAAPGTPNGPVTQNSFSSKQRDSQKELQSEDYYITESGLDDAVAWQAGADCMVQITPKQPAKPASPVSMAAEGHAEQTAWPLVIQQPSTDGKHRSDVEVPQELTSSSLVVRALSFQEDPADVADSPDERCPGCCKLETRLQVLQAEVRSCILSQLCCKPASLEVYCFGECSCICGHISGHGLP